MARDPLIEALRGELLDASARLTDEVMVMRRCARRVPHAADTASIPWMRDSAPSETRSSSVRKTVARPTPRLGELTDELLCGERLLTLQRRRDDVPPGDVRRRPESPSCRRIDRVAVAAAGITETEYQFRRERAARIGPRSLS